jgi:hypothetical protein
MQVPLIEAAAVLGVSSDTVRRRLAIGELTGEKRKTRHGLAWFVDVPDEAVEAVAVERDHADMEEVAALRGRVEYLDLRLEHLREENQQLRADRDAWRELVQRGDEERRELRLLIAQALDSRQAITATAGDERPAGLWQRLRG